VNPGDKLIYIFANKGGKVFVNNQKIGDFTNADLAYRLLAGFIGNHPPSESLRSALLGLPE